MKITHFDFDKTTISDNIVHQVIIHFEGTHNSYSGVLRADYEEFKMWADTSKKLHKKLPRNEDGEFCLVMSIIELEVQRDDSLQEDFLRWVL